MKIIKNSKMQEIQKDTLQPKQVLDTVPKQKKIHWVEIIPSEKISSSEGAMLPKEAIEMVKLEPAMPAPKEEENPQTSYYIIIGIVIFTLLICTKFILNRFKSK